MKLLQSKFRVAIPVVIVVIGFLIMGFLSNSRSSPPRARIRPRGALVEIMQVKPVDRQILIEGSGTVTPRHQVILLPQVAGKVVWVHPNLVAGGAFKEGDELIRIDQSDYALAVQRAEAQVAQAEYQIQLAKANAAIAEREWELVKSGRDRLVGSGGGEFDEPDPLVLHKPQLKQAEANLAAAEAALATAQLNLSRTVLRAPFNCRVREQSVAPGQLISPTSQAAVLYATDVVEIDVGLPQSDLAWLEIPGASARVILDTGHDRHTWHGTVARTVGIVDEIGRLARVVIQVDEPFDSTMKAKPELSIGSFVSVEIEGRVIEQTIAIPRSALRTNATVWVATPDSTLEIRTVTVERLTPQEALIADGISSDDHVILTPLAGAAPGMAVRPVIAAGEGHS
jgi:RND family efflux transporter MFP subunit